MRNLVSTCVLGGVLLTGSLAAQANSQSTAVSVRVTRQVAQAATSTSLGTIIHQLTRIVQGHASAKGPF
jgi:hypothetical protein